MNIICSPLDTPRTRKCSGSGLGWGYFFMKTANKHKLASSLRTIAFFDGQNLFHAAKEAFGYDYPNYDPKKLAKAICVQQGWQLVETHFYTGVPNASDNAFWYHFWVTKLGQIGRGKKVYTFSRSLRYRPRTITTPSGQQQTVFIGEEKGIDVRIAIDCIRSAHKQTYDVALIFSQDQDLSEVAEEIRTIAKEQNRWIKIACAFPANIGKKNSRGIDKTDWIKIDKALYDAYRDQRDYRPPKIAP